MKLFSGVFSKELFAAIAAATVAYQSGVADGVLSGGDIGAIVAAFLVGLGVTAVVPFQKYLKPIAATTVTAATFLATAVSGGIDANEWYGLAAIFFTALGAFVFPNASASTKQ